MRQITVDLYQFEELSDAAKKVARQWFSSYKDVSDFKCTELDIVERAKALGYDIEVRWSGFHSQGDGACFVGSWDASDVEHGKTKEECPKDEELHKIADALEYLAKKYPDAIAKLTHRGHYSHENSVDYEFSNTDESEYPLDDNFTDEFEVYSRKFMRWAYKQLDEQNDYLHSDEYIDESIIANGYEFTADGVRAKYSF